VSLSQGFDILFNIIAAEGGASEPTVVVQDCLRICSNILQGSETCQRLFYGMDGGWHWKLLDFFDPILLESIGDKERNRSTSTSRSDKDRNEDVLDDVESDPWYLQPIRLDCAVMALNALADSQNTPNDKHQRIIGISGENIISAATFWVTRLGPSELVAPGLRLLENVVRGNETVASHVYGITLRVPLSVPGHTTPAGIDSTIVFAWKPVASDERRLVSIPTLLADRYVWRGEGWIAAARLSRGPGSVPGGVGVGGEFVLSTACLQALDAVLAGSSTTSGLVMQHILAPPLPNMDDEMSGTLETMKPFGAVVLNALVESCAKLISWQGGIGADLRMDINIAQRCADLLSLVLIHGGLLSRELATALSTGHTSLGAGRGGPVVTALVHQPLLPFLLSTAGRAARVPNGGHELMAALLRMLAAAATDCPPAVVQVSSRQGGTTLLTSTTETVNKNSKPNPNRAINIESV